MRLEALDGLRGIAIALVVWFHIWQLSWLNPQFSLFGHPVSLEYLPVTGAIGVELFFFISGFCLYYPYARHLLEGKSLPTLVHYAYRRFIKIVPSYYLSILLVLLFFPCFSRWNETLWQAIAHFLFIHNWFGETYGTINGVYWSLGVEVQFYLVFPLLAWLFRRRPWATYLAMVAVALLYRHLIPIYGAERWGFWLNQLPGMLDLFAGGMLTAHLLVSLRNRELVVRLKPLWTGLAIAAFALFLLLLDNLYQVRYSPNVFCVWPTRFRWVLSLVFATLTLSSLLSFAAWQRVLANPALLFLSTLSYNLYLWHQFIARILFERRIPLPNTTDPHLDPQWQLLYSFLALVLSLAVAAFFTYVVERPLLQYGFKGCWERWKSHLAEARLKLSGV